MNRGSVSAPGKLFLCGEYAVLDGAPAIVCAVNRRAVATWRKTGEANVDVTPEVARARELAEQACGAVPHALHIDVAALRSETEKFGLGSSAAKAAVAAGAVFGWYGTNVASPASRAAILDHALAGHATISPNGSGADVAAAVLGGFLRFRRAETGLALANSPAPAALRMRVVWTGYAASTSDMVQRVRAFQQGRPGAAKRHASELALLAEDFAEAWTDGDAHRVQSVAGAYGDAMGALGRDADVSIVDDRLQKIATLARKAGGAAKPSGAGGGDVAIGFFTSDEAANRFETNCEASGLRPMDLGLGAHGLTARTDS